MNILDELQQRGILKDVTNREKFAKIDKKSVYIGFDPTAESLHLGNYIQIAILLRFKGFGFNPIAVLGGATGMIGDPSGKSNERNLLDNNQLEINKAKIKKQLEKYSLKVIDNLDFYKDMNVLNFLRKVGKHININYMLNKEIVSSRLETGISFTEFAYQLIQGWDFKELYEKHNISIQVGGSDQWGNITTGVELIRKTLGDDNQAVGITTNLLTTSSGKKIGKTEGGAVWLDSSMTTPFQLYQYLLNIQDQDVDKILKWFTFLNLSEIDQIIKEHDKDKSKRFAQKKLAHEMVKDIHSLKDANLSVKLSNILFGKANFDLSSEEILMLDKSIPTFDNVVGNLIDVMVETKMTSSKREAREFVNNNSISINGKIINDIEHVIDNKKPLLIRRGKKKYFLLKY